MKFQTNDGKIFNATSFNRFISRIEQGTYYVAKVLLDNETWVVNWDEDEETSINKFISFVKKFKMDVQVSKVERYIDEFEQKNLYKIVYDTENKKCKIVK